MWLLCIFLLPKGNIKNTYSEVPWLETTEPHMLYYALLISNLHPQQIIIKTKLPFWDIFILILLFFINFLNTMNYDDEVLSIISSPLHVWWHVFLSNLFYGEWYNSQEPTFLLQSVDQLTMAQDMHLLYMYYTLFPCIKRDKGYWNSCSKSPLFRGSFCNPWI